MIRGDENSTKAGYQCLLWKIVKKGSGWSRTIFNNIEKSILKWTWVPLCHMCQKWTNTIGHWSEQRHSQIHVEGSLGLFFSPSPEESWEGDFIRGFRVLAVVREHWQVEGCCHSSLNKHVSHRKHAIYSIRFWSCILSSVSPKVSEFRGEVLGILAILAILGVPTMALRVPEILRPSLPHARKSQQVQEWLRHFVAITLWMHIKQYRD